MRSALRLGVATVLAALMAFAGTAVASAHATRTATDPVENASLTTAPSRVSATFNEQLQPDVCGDDGCRAGWPSVVTRRSAGAGRRRQHRRATVGTGRRLHRQLPGHLRGRARGVRLVVVHADATRHREPRVLPPQGRRRIAGCRSGRSWRAPPCSSPGAHCGRCGAGRDSGWAAVVGRRRRCGGGDVGGGAGRWPTPNCRWRPPPCAPSPTARPSPPWVGGRTVARRAALPDELSQRARRPLILLGATWILAELTRLTVTAAQAAGSPITALSLRTVSQFRDEHHARPLHIDRYRSCCGGHGHRVRSHSRHGATGRGPSPRPRRGSRRAPSPGICPTACWAASRSPVTRWPRACGAAAWRRWR